MWAHRLLLFGLVGGEAFAFLFFHASPRARSSLTMRGSMLPELPERDVPVALYPVGVGTFQGREAAFLGQEKGVVDPSSPLLPVPIADETGVTILTSALKGLAFGSCSALVNQDDGLFDNIPWDTWGDSYSKRRVYNQLMLGGGQQRPEGAKGVFDLIDRALSTECNARAVGFAIEEEYSRDPRAIKLGGAVLLEAKGNQEEEEDDDDNDANRSPTSAAAAAAAAAYSAAASSGSRGAREGERFVVECACEEALAMALWARKPVMVMQSVFEGGGVRTKLVRDKQGKPRLAVSDEEEYYMREAEREAQREAAAAAEAQGRSRRRRRVDDNDDDDDDDDEEGSSMYPPAWKIKTVGQLLEMTLAEKCATVEASGLKAPRKRGTNDESVCALLLPLLDEVVRRQYLTYKAVMNEDYELAASLDEDKSARQVLVGELNAAVKNGDEEAADVLRERLDVLTALRADPTQDEGSYQRDMDADEWYIQNRKRMS